MGRTPPIADLARVAELIRLGAETARCFSETSVDGKFSSISEAAARIEAAADDLARIARELQQKPPEEL